MEQRDYNLLFRWFVGLGITMQSYRVAKLADEVCRERWGRAARWVA